MKKKICCLIFLIINTGAIHAQIHSLWEIGLSDNSSAEFALAHGDYEKFLEYDFGWEDRFFLIGSSDEQKDFPFVLPGAYDYWGGTSGLAGIRPHEINVLFGISELPKQTNYELIIDVLDCSVETPPLVKISINGRPWKFKLNKGKNEDALKGVNTGTKEQLLHIPISEADLKMGGNTVQITILEGSYLIFDHIRLEASNKTALLTPKKAFVRNVEAATYQLEKDDAMVQPLLLDIQHLDGFPKIEVDIDGKTMFTETLDHGRAVYEVPMPAVKMRKNSNYLVKIDGEPISRGSVKRQPETVNSLADYVDTKIGTGHSRWMIAPGPWMPFSMVKISPDNQEGGWQAGYQPSFESIGCFSHIHEWTMAGLGTLPTNGPLITEVGKPDDPDSGYRSRIDKSTEEAPLGYYSVVLSDYDIKAEMTATSRASFQRYTYPLNSKDSRILIDFQIPSEYGYELEEVHLKKISDSKIAGYSKQISKGIWGEGHYRKQFIEDGDEPKEWDDISQEYTVHFVMEFDSPIQEFGAFVDGSKKGKQDNETTFKDEFLIKNPEDVVAFVQFNTSKDQSVQTRTAISYVSMEHAALNLEQEISVPFGWDFNKIREHHKSTWNDLFERVQIETNDRQEKTRFYSNMYRALVSRNTFSDVDGSWVDAEEKVQKFGSPQDLALGCDAFWNTFWNLNQFWNLVTPEWSSKWVRSQLAMYDANGWLAKGPAGMEYIPVMVAEHEIPLLVAAYQMGIRDFDAQKAFQAIYKMQTTPGEKVGNGFAGNRDLLPYLEFNYVPYNKGRFSNTLEYSFDDFAVSQMALALGKQEAYDEFIDRGYWWKNAINPETGFAHLRNSDGSWYPNFDPIKTAGNFQFVEGNAWQLTYFVPQDIPALAAITGKANMAKRLDDGFNVSSKWRYNAPNELYWDFPVTQGNQQSMHFSFLFNWLEKPWLTQKWSRDIMDRYYGHGISNAYLGDEDQGQMSAWFIMSALGLFQTDGGTRTEPIYEIGSPLFEKTVIDLGGQYGRGKQFTIEAKNSSYTNKFVQRAMLNGKRLETFWFPASELLKGGSLVLEMGPEPNENWGVEQLPPSPQKTK